MAAPTELLPCQPSCCSQARCALLEAVRGAHDAVVEKLCDCPGLWVDAIDSLGGGSALQLSACSFARAPCHYLYIMHLLCARGCDVTVADNSGATALVGAYVGGCMERRAGCTSLLQFAQWHVTHATVMLVEYRGNING